MSKYTEKQAHDKAVQIHDRFGERIAEACAGSTVPEDFLAGFIGVEAGVDHSGRIKESATRFEQGVYHHLLAVRSGLLHSYDLITRKDIADATDDALHNLATSFGLTQIMGWHVIHDLACTIEDLKDPEKHLHFCVQLLRIVSGRYLTKGDWSSVLHIWNSGSANGKTYDPNYVFNALAVKAAYAELLKSRQASAVSDQKESAAALPGAVDTSTEDASGSSQPSDPTSNEQSPALDVGTGQAAGGSWDSAKAQYEALGSKIDSVSGTVGEFTERRDAAKSLWATIGGTIKQLVWAVLAFVTGMPPYIYVTVAVMTGVLVILYIRRQTVLGKIRDLAQAGLERCDHV